MKVEQIGDFRTVSLNDLGGTKVVALSHMGEVETTMTLDDAKQVADQIMAWDIEQSIKAGELDQQYREDPEIPVDNSTKAIGLVAVAMIIVMQVIY